MTTEYGEGAVFEGMFFDINGKPIELEEWGELIKGTGGDEYEYKRIGLDQVGECRVSTVWLGINHRWTGDGRPLIFETMVFGGKMDGEQWRWETKEQAEREHKRIVCEVREEEGNGQEGSD